MQGRAVTWGLIEHRAPPNSHEVHLDNHASVDQRSVSPSSLRSRYPNDVIINGVHAYQRACAGLHCNDIASVLQFTCGTRESSYFN